MVQDSIVDYINAQTKAGVSRDAIKATLTGAGWTAVDVEDTLRKIEASKTAQPMTAAMPMSSAVSPAAAKPAQPATQPPVTSRLITPMGGPATVGSGMPASAGSQTIKVNDLVSSSASGPGSVTKPAGQRSPMTGPSAAPAMAMPTGSKTANTFQASSYSGAKPRASHGALIVEIVLIVIILAVGGFAGFLYMQNNNLNAQLSSLNGQSTGVNSQLSALQSQVAASTTALSAQVSALTTEDQELQTELSFLVVPTSTVAGVTSTATIGGVVSAGKTSYVITAAYGTKIYVMNSKAAAVIAALAPLLGSPAAAPAATSTAGATSTAAAGTPATPATPAQFTGTYVPGSDTITLTAVNGTAL